MKKDTKTGLFPVQRGAARFRFRAAEHLSSIRFRILGIVTAGVIIPSFLGGWIASHRIETILRDQAYREIRARAERLAERLEVWIEDRAGEAKDFALTSILLREEIDRLVSSEGDEERSEARRGAERYLAYLLEDNPHFDVITILDPDGRVLAARPAAAETASWDPPPNPEGPLPLLGEHALGGVQRLFAAVRMGTVEGRDSPVFVAWFREGVLEEALGRLAPEGSTVYLVDGDGTIRTSGGSAARGGRAPAEVMTLLHGKAETSVFRGIGGEDVIGAASTLGDLPLGIVMETSRVKAMRPLAALGRQMVLVVLALAGAFLVPALLLARTIVLPLEELSNVSRLIRSGQPGLQVKMKAGGELGELIVTFNTMSQSLKASMEEIITIYENLKEMSITDPLTGRYNRRYLEDYLARELPLLDRSATQMSVLMLDMDRFKDFNDRYGHIAGDDALKRVGEILVRTLRKTDVVVRFGGEEWIVCLHGAGTEAGLAAGEKLRKAVEDARFEVREGEARLTVSVGVATAPADGATPEAVISAADAALYAAKEAGRNRVFALTGSGGRGSSPQGRKRS